MFQSNQVNLEVLRQRAYNLRWATLPHHVIPLTAADPDFPCAQPIVNAIHSYASKGYFSYGPAEGLPFFKESIADYYATYRQVPVDPAWVLPVDSAAFGIYTVCKTVLKPGDNAIVFDPVDFLFRYSVEQCFAEARSFPIDAQSGDVDEARLESLIDERTRLLCLCNPLNPTGKVFTPDELQIFVRIAEKHNLMILSDEIWSDIVFQPHIFTSIASISEAARKRTFLVHGFSKSYGLAGLRIGMVIAPDANRFNAVLQASLHTSTVHGANTLSQVAAHSALTECRPWLQEFVHHLQDMRDTCVQRVQRIPHWQCQVPQGSYVLFIRIADFGINSEQMHQILLEKAHVAVVPGLAKWFGPGAENYIRISFATSKNILNDAFDRIENSLKTL